MSELLNQVRIEIKKADVNMLKYVSGSADSQYWNGYSSALEWVRDELQMRINESAR